MTPSATIRDLLRLHLVEGIGPVLATRLLQAFGDTTATLAAPLSRLSAVQGISKDVARRIADSSYEAADNEIELAAKHGVQLIGYTDSNYPAILRQIADPPIVLYVRGNLLPEDALAIAIVGARQCTIYGAEQAERFAGLAATAGLTVVSGMALGIDTAAHRGALRAGGRTLAILGCGMCHLYPPKSGALADQIMADGALISDMPMQTPPAEHTFPRRNRVIAGLSLGTLVIEAGMQSGALITARLASEYNREVFALPGHVDDPSAEGCHHLIRTGAAKLVTGMADILEELGEAGAAMMPQLSRSSQKELFDTPAPSPAILAALPPIERGVLDAMPAGSVSVEQLIAAADLTPAKAAAALTSLLLKGLVRRMPGDLYSRVG